MIDRLKLDMKKVRKISFKILFPEPEPKAQKVEASPSSQKKVVRKTNDSKKAKSSINIKKTTIKKYGKYGQ